eukprot:UN13724
MSEEDEEYPEDRRPEIWAKVRANKCGFWSDKYESCKQAFQALPEAKKEDATCVGWYYDLWSCIGKYGAPKILAPVKGYEHHH